MLTEKVVWFQLLCAEAVNFPTGQLLGFLNACAPRPRCHARLQNNNGFEDILLTSFSCWDGEGCLEMMASRLYAELGRNIHEDIGDSLWK